MFLRLKFLLTENGMVEELQQWLPGLLVTQWSLGFAPSLSHTLCSASLHLGLPPKTNDTAPAQHPRVFSAVKYTQKRVSHLGCCM